MASAERARLGAVGSARRHGGGFTLPELIAVIVIFAILSVLAGRGLLEASVAYDTARQRTELTDVAERAMRQVGRDIRLAVPGSLRSTVPSAGTYYLELLIAKNGGRYRSQSGGDILDITTADTSFESLGPMSTLPSQQIVAGDYVVVNNVNAEAGAPTLNAYTHREAVCTGSSYNAQCNTAEVASISHAVDASTIGIVARRFPMASSSYAFYVMSGTPAVTYECIRGAPDAQGNGTGTLKRYQNYPATLAKTTPPAGGTASIVAEHVSDCAIILRSDLGIAYLQITLTRANAQATFYHQVAVPNA